LTSTGMSRYPSGFGRLLCALDFYLDKPKEIALVGAADAPETISLAREIWSRYLPNKVVAACRPGDEQAATAIPLLKGKGELNGSPTAYVCEDFTCKKPVTTAVELAGLLHRNLATAP